MGKKFSLQLSVPKPCHENWDKMTPNERGRHCDSCNKSVNDFSLLSDRQLIEFFTKATGNICGRVTNLQLNRLLVYVEPRNSFLYKLLFGTAISLGIAGSANANYNPNQKPFIEKYVEIDENHKKSIPTDSTATDTILKVRVLDSQTKAALPFASVVLFYNGRQIGGEQTNLDGLATITISDFFIGKKISLKVIYAGFHDSSMGLTIEKRLTSVTISMNTLIIMGEVVIEKREPPAFDNTSGWDKQTLRPNDTPYK